MSQLRRELQELEQEAEKDMKLESQDPELEARMLSEEIIDEFFQALQAPEEPKVDDLRTHSNLQLSRARAAVGHAPALFSPVFRKDVSNKNHSALQAQRLETLLARLNDAEPRHQQFELGLPRPLPLQSLRSDNEQPGQQPKADNLEETPQMQSSEHILANANVEALSEAISEDSLLKGDITVPELASMATAAVLQGRFEVFTKALNYADRFDSIKSSGTAQIQVVETAVKSLSHYGHADALMRVLEEVNHRDLSMTSEMRHSFVSLFIRQGDLPKAASTLRAFEPDVPAPIKTYSALIRRLLRAQEPWSHEEAWSLFYHMRLVAHPVPDSQLYTVMINACSAGRLPKNAATRRGQSEGERALDLFRELTVAYQIRPSVEAFNATILACAKSPYLYNEAIQLFRQMLKLQGSGSDHYIPDQDAFNALLAGCARKGDLGRAKWILSEMLRLARAFAEDVQKQDANYHLVQVLARLPDERTLALLFSTYAAYKPPLTQAKIRQSDHPMSKPHNVEIEHSATSGSLSQVVLSRVHAETSREDLSAFDASTQAPSSTSALPQTSRDVVSEVSRLFESVLKAIERLRSEQTTTFDVWMKVRPSVALVNAYLKVLARHLPRSQRLVTVNAAITGTGDDNESFFIRLGLSPNSSTLELVLKLCCAEPDRTLADKVANDLWAKHSNWIMSNAEGWKAWCTYINGLAKSHHLQAAVSELKRLISAHPPINKLYLQTRRPSNAQCQALLYDIETSAYPALTFHHVDVLHHRLVDANDQKGLAVVAWALHAYGNQAKFLESVMLQDCDHARSLKSGCLPGSLASASVQDTACIT
ncbi:hypothetical protein K437DRAFT_266284 [Tilletiaria anomala UBC 951]|uniref:Pentacotripeptide-repeat region of PRORP domain-containing protein n=1 Tax=Tilletiaria anomala (strain ATCC 24038 / CBS 436.72 / UBC 951) TaxID=1037660 RepID=A0A066WQF9_TILAU|nr:uncharacterized protein K437DRAFT_266284 [Tilletiaria anomala UBC 951]KDN52835.1 hypothetical protein K437DRAFT_266284 [Tilletiaria anomala UBC 951]